MTIIFDGSVVNAILGIFAGILVYVLIGAFVVGLMARRPSIGLHRYNSEEAFRRVAGWPLFLTLIVVFYIVQLASGGAFDE